MHLKFNYQHSRLVLIHLVWRGDSVLKTFSLCKLLLSDAQKHEFSIYFLPVDVSSLKDLQVYCQEQLSTFMLNGNTITGKHAKENKR